MKTKIQIFDDHTSHSGTAQALFSSIAYQPLICPHGHVDANLFADPHFHFGNPTQLFILPDHYIIRMLFSQGISPVELGLSRSLKDRQIDPRKVWQIFCDQFHIFAGTPSGLWIENELSMVFDILETPDHQNAQDLYDHIQDTLDSSEFTPRKLFDRFNIEVLCTTNSALDSLENHRLIRESSWPGIVIPTFRPDQLLDIADKGWLSRIEALSDLTELTILNYDQYIQAIEKRRSFFQQMGAVATDHAAENPYTCRLSHQRISTLFEKGLRQCIDVDEAHQFHGHMMYEMARMSVEDGMVMQFHVGAFRNHHTGIFENLGQDVGFDIPLQVEWTRNLQPLLEVFGMDSRLRLILFTLDETSYSRELAPMAGVYPSVFLGPPWWFHDSPNGMMRYFDHVMETAGIFNTVGFNDDTRAFLSIPARHDLWRRMSALWLAKLVHRGQLDFKTAEKRMQDLAVNLARRGYRFNQAPYQASSV